MEAVTQVTSNAAVEINRMCRKETLHLFRHGRTALVPIRHMTQINRDSLTVSREICHPRYSLQGYLSRNFLPVKEKHIFMMSR